MGAFLFFVGAIVVPGMFLLFCFLMVDDEIKPRMGRRYNVPGYERPFVREFKRAVEQKQIETGQMIIDDMERIAARFSAFGVSMKYFEEHFHSSGVPGYWLGEPFEKTAVSDGDELNDWFEHCKQYLEDENAG